MKSTKTKIISLTGKKEEKKGGEEKPLTKIIEKRVKDIYFDSLKEIDDLLNDKM